VKTTAGPLELERPRVRNVTALGFCSEIVGKAWRALVAPAALHKRLHPRHAEGDGSHSPADDCEAGSGAVRDSSAQLLSTRATAHDEHRAHGAVGDALADAAQRGQPVQPAAADDHEVRALGGGD
jgi:hypothetical protein